MLKWRNSPKTNMFPKKGPFQKETRSYNHQFSGHMLVSGRVNQFPSQVMLYFHSTSFIFYVIGIALFKIEFTYIPEIPN